MTPFATALTFTLAAVIPIRIPGVGSVAPLWPLIAVGFWSLARPDLFPAAAAFAIGLLYDALSGAPIGVHAAVFVLAYAAVSSQRRFFHGKPFSLVWLGFALVLAGSLAAAWLLTSLWNATLMPARALVLQFFVTLGCFPVAAWALHGWRRLVLRSV